MLARGCCDLCTEENTCNTVIGREALDLGIGGVRRAVEEKKAKEADESV